MMIGSILHVGAQFLQAFVLGHFVTFHTFMALDVCRLCVPRFGCCANNFGFDAASLRRLSAKRSDLPHNWARALKGCLESYHAQVIHLSEP